MKTKLFKKYNNEGGSATIEAIVSFTGFLFVIFTLLSLVNLCRTQMLISSAMDNAAKELSQYSYFYKMSGLQKFSKALNDKSAVGKSHINEVIGSVDDLYSSMVDAVDTTQEGYTNIAEATKDGSFDMSTFQSAYNDLSDDVSAVGDNIGQMSAQFENIGNNPMLYMKSLVAIASSSGLDLVKSHAIAAPLAKFFVQQQFGETAEEAHETLKSLGVKGGLYGEDGQDGMNFKMSTVFSETHEEDIRLVVYYKLTLLQLFDWEILEVNMCKQSVCRAWLAGDNPGEFVLKDDLPTAPSESEGSNESPGEGSNESPGENPDNDSDAGSGDGSGMDTDEPIDLTNSRWDNGAYMDCLPLLRHLSSINGMPVVSTADTLKNDKPLYFTDSTSMVMADKDTAKLISADIQSSLNLIAWNLEEFDSEDVQRVFVYEVFVPENISDEDYKKVEKAVDDAEWDVDFNNEFLSNQEEPAPPLYLRGTKNVEYKIVIKKAGGNYDYAGGGGQ